VSPLETWFWLVFVFVGLLGLGWYVAWKLMGDVGEVYGR